MRVKRGNLWDEIFADKSHEDAAVERIDENIIAMNGKVTSLAFYEEFLPKLSNYFKKREAIQIAPIISIEKVNWLDARVLPNLMCIGVILKKFYKKPTRLLLKYNPTLLYFLYNSDFFRLVGKSELNLYDYDEAYIGGFRSFIEKEYRDKHVISFFNPYKDFYQRKHEEQLAYKEATFYKLSSHNVPHIFGEVLSDIKAFDGKELEICLDCLSEIICNSIIYSKSLSFAYLQTNQYGTFIAVSDVGIGFEESLSKKTEMHHQKDWVDNKFEKKCQITTDFLDKQWKDFFILFDVLEYSRKQGRVNLWKLKRMVVKRNGTFRLHTNNVQIIFSSTRCGGCSQENAWQCIDCILCDYRSQKDISPLRFFTTKLKGVHLEIDLYREGKS